jgi:hypothetical protein
MLKQLEAYYASNGILSTSFTCWHSHQCSANSPRFTGPKSAYISTGYERGELPRLLFLSLDSGSAEEDPRERLPAAVRQQEEVDRPIFILPKGRHWYRTHELAWYVLRRFKPALALEKAKHYFAHANSAKCCMNNEHNAKADSTLFRNCKRYLCGELAILAPEIVVTQGNEAKLAMWNLSTPLAPSIDEFSSLVKLQGRQVFWLHTYHPNNYGAFNKQRNYNKATQTADGWESYASAVFKFVKEQKNA